MAFDFNTFGQTPETTTQPKKVSGFDFNSFGSVAPVNKKLTADQKSAQNYGALFPSKEGDSPIKAGFKALGNLPGSAYGLIKSLGSAVLHPVQTIQAIGKPIGEKIGTEVGYALSKNKEFYDKSTPTFDALTGALKERYGSLENLQRTATNDPFGFGTDVLMVLQGGAGALEKTVELNKALSTTAKGVTIPAGKVTEGVSGAVSKTTKFGVSQATGLNPETISNIIKDPKAFTPEALKETTRVNLGSSVKEAIDVRLDNLSDIGSGYETIRQLPVKVSVPQNLINDTLKKYGIEVVDGKVKVTAEAKPFTTADKTALEDFINVYGNEPVLSSNAFLNARQGLSQLSKYDAAKTGNLTPVARELRGLYDQLGKEQIPGLSQLDSLYAPEVKQLSQIKSDYLTKTGEFKDGAINKIANLTGAGKEQVLGRLEKIVPGIEQRIKIVKAAEDIERASGLKVGTYARAGLGVFGVSTFNLPAILTAIIASPEVAVRLLRAYGFTNKTAQPIIKALYNMANDVNNFRLPGQMQKYVDEYLKNPKMGMSIEDITRSQPELAQTGKNIKGNQAQLSSPKPTIKSTPESTLLSEAKKYKSAEEFVNSQSKLFRAGEPFDAKKITSQGVSLTPNIDRAKNWHKYLGSFDKRVSEVYISPNAKIMSFSQIPDTLFKKLTNGKLMPNETKGLESFSKMAEFAKSKGYDGLDLTPFGENELRIVNPKVLQTKSQLTDIWNKANKVKTSLSPGESSLLSEAKNTPDIRRLKQAYQDGVTLYRGEGGGGGLKAREDIGNALGEGKYYANFSQASRYGKNIKEATVKLKNPLIIQTDQDLRNITGGFNLVVSSKAGVTPQMVKQQIAQTRRAIIDAGYDGVIIKMKSYQDSQNLQRLFEHDQTIVY